MISSFTGEFRFLSNFWPAEVSLDGEVYPSVEHAYQAAKTINTAQRAAIRVAKGPGIAKRLGKTVTLRSDWNTVRLTVMRDLLKQKFSDPNLRQRLLATHDEELVEGNQWGDQFWGVARGRGQNHLGRLLMEVRKESTK